MRKNIWLYPLTLLVITGIITIGLHFLNNATKSRIESQSLIEKKLAREAVIEEIAYNTAEEAESYVKYFDSKKKLVAIVFEETTNGYGGEIKSIVGVKFDDGVAEVTGVKVISQSETAGLGANVTKDSFLAQFVQKIAGIEVVKNKPNDNEIQALTGATITSKAITEAVNKALKQAGEIM